jgi:hypothetical protein
MKKLNLIVWCAILGIAACVFVGACFAAIHLIIVLFRAYADFIQGATDGLIKFAVVMVFVLIACTIVRPWDTKQS